MRYVKLTISILYYCIRAAWHRIIAACGGMPNRACHTTLFYHEVRPHQRTAFASQMDILKQSACPVSTEFSGPFERSTWYVSLTFDDAFCSVLENAVPVLIEKKIPAAIFVPTAYFDQPPGWITAPGNPCHDQRIMSPEQIRSLPPEFFTIGSHTHTHRHLTELSNQEVEFELTHSKTLLEKCIDRPVTQIAFPYGSYSGQIVAAAGHAGYTRAFATLPVRGNTLLLGRVETLPDDRPIEFRLKVLGAYNWLPRAVQLKRRISSLLTEVFVPKRVSANSKQNT